MGTTSLHCTVVACINAVGVIGSVYVSTFLSKSFRVKKFVIKDANLFPIQVSCLSAGFCPCGSAWDGPDP